MDKYKRLLGLITNNFVASCYAIAMPSGDWPQRVSYDVGRSMAVRAAEEAGMLIMNGTAFWKRLKQFQTPYPNVHFEDSRGEGKLAWHLERLIVQLYCMCQMSYCWDQNGKGPN